MASWGILGVRYSFLSLRKKGTYYALGEVFVVNKYNRLLVYKENYAKVCTVFYYKLLGNNNIAYLRSMYSVLPSQLNRIPCQYFLSCFEEVVFDDINVQDYLLETLPELEEKLEKTNYGTYAIRRSDN
jgi:hypothetical protein